MRVLFECFQFVNRMFRFLTKGRKNFQRHGKSLELMNIKKYIYFLKIKNLIELPLLLTKLRPFIHTFLKEESKMFEMYIYTMSDCLSALCIVIG